MSSILDRISEEEIEKWHKARSMQDRANELMKEVDQKIHEAAMLEAEIQETDVGEPHGEQSAFGRKWDYISGVSNSKNIFIDTGAIHIGEKIAKSQTRGNFSALVEKLIREEWSKMEAQS